MTTKEKILQVAEQLLLEKGFGRVRLSDIAKELNISQQAVSKHFQSKDSLWSQLAENWLTQILTPVYVYESPAKATVERICHDWLWLLCSRKRTAYQDQPELFKLYSHYLLADRVRAEEELDRLIAQLSAVSGLTDLTKLQSLLTLMSAFHYPQFVSDWDEYFQENFENCWQQLAPFYEKINALSPKDPQN